MKARILLHVVDKKDFQLLYNIITMISCTGYNGLLNVHLNMAYYADCKFSEKNF